MSERFECILDPCNRYVIWDNEAEIPVLHHGRILSYANWAQGQRIAAAINTTSRPKFMRGDRTRRFAKSRVSRIPLTL
jgi:hypothetical protein